MRIRCIQSLAVVDFHDTYALRNVVDITVFAVALLVDRVIAFGIQGSAGRSSNAGASARGDDSLGSCGAGCLRAARHERQDQTLKSIDAILHAVGCAIHASRGIRFLPTARGCV